MSSLADTSNNELYEALRSQERRDYFWIGFGFAAVLAALSHLVVFFVQSMEAARVQQH